jgi:hypothetical protein
VAEPVVPHKVPMPRAGYVRLGGPIGKDSTECEHLHVERCASRGLHDLTEELEPSVVGQGALLEDVEPDIESLGCHLQRPAGSPSSPPPHFRCDASDSEHTSRNEGTGCLWGSRSGRKAMTCGKAAEGGPG